MHYAIFSELCDRMRFEVDYAKSHHRVISEALCICDLGQFVKTGFSGSESMKFIYLNCR